MAGTSYSQLFLSAKNVLRQHPAFSDEQVADTLAVHKLDSQAMRTIAQARKDLYAGTHALPELKPREEGQA